MVEFSVVTFNTWNCQGHFSRRLPLMVRGLRKVNADVVLLQEVFAQAPVGTHVGKRLAEALGLYLSFVPARKKLRTLNGAPILSHSGLAVLSKTPVLQQRTVRLPTDPRDGERLGQVALLQLGGLRVQVGNVHLTHLPDGDGLRRRQLETLVGALDKPADITILGGDMNADQGHAIFNALDGFAAANILGAQPRSSLNPVGGGVNDTGVIDHLYVRPAAGRDVICSARVALNDADAKTGMYASDHMAVVANVTVA